MSVKISTTAHTINYNGMVFNYNETANGVQVIVPKGTKISMEKYVSDLHKLDRTHYDTPASVSGCPCKSCNESRSRHGKKNIPGFDKQKIADWGIIDGTDITISQLESMIEKELEIKY